MRPPHQIKLSRLTRSARLFHGGVGGFFSCGVDSALPASPVPRSPSSRLALPWPHPCVFASFSSFPLPAVYSRGPPGFPFLIDRFSFVFLHQPHISKPFIYLSSLPVDLSIYCAPSHCHGSFCSIPFITYFPRYSSPGLLLLLHFSLFFPSFTLTATNTATLDQSPLQP